MRIGLLQSPHPGQQAVPGGGAGGADRQDGSVLLLVDTRLLHHSPSLGLLARHPEAHHGEVVVVRVLGGQGSHGRTAEYEVGNLIAESERGTLHWSRVMMLLTLHISYAIKTLNQYKEHFTNSGIFVPFAISLCYKQSISRDLDQ